MPLQSSIRLESLPELDDLRALCPPLTRALEGHREQAQPGEQCQICGLPLASHPRCPACTILVGPGHLEERLHAGLCSSCLRYRQRRARRLRTRRAR